MLLMDYIQGHILQCQYFFKRKLNVNTKHSLITSDLAPLCNSWDIYFIDKNELKLFEYTFFLRKQFTFYNSSG